MAAKGNYLRELVERNSDYMNTQSIKAHVKTLSDMLFSVRVCAGGCLRVTLSLTYSFSIVPEEWSLSSSTVAQGNDQS